MHDWQDGDLDLLGRLLELMQGSAADWTLVWRALASLDDADQRLRLRDRQASYDLANAQFKRIAQLLERQMISRAEYDQRKATLDSGVRMARTMAASITP